MNADSSTDSYRELNFCSELFSPQVEAFLLLQRAAWATSDEPAKLVRSQGITPHQFNVLKILEVIGDEGISCSGISERMITRDSDVTRLLDKLVRDDYAKRERSSEDRRIVLAKLTPKGKALCDKLTEPLIQLHQEYFERLTPDECVQLSTLLNKLCDHPCPERSALIENQQHSAEA